MITSKYEELTLPGNIPPVARKGAGSKKTASKFGRSQAPGTPRTPRTPKTPKSGTKRKLGTPKRRTPKMKEKHSGEESDNSSIGLNVSMDPEDRFRTEVDSDGNILIISYLSYIGKVFRIELQCKANVWC